jgi:hypothetical protein
MEEVDDDVVVSYIGSLDTTGMGFGSGSNPNLRRVAPSSPNVYFLFLPAGLNGYYSHEGFGDDVWSVPPTAYGTGGATDTAIGSGDNFAFSPVSVMLAPGYVSETSISGTMTFQDASFDTLGIAAPVNMTATTSSGDTITVTAAPEPATMSLLGLGAVALLKRRRK